MTPTKLVATDIVHAIPVSLVGGISYLALGITDCWLLILLLTGSIPATILSSTYIIKLNTNVIRNLLGVILIAVGIKLFILT